MNFIIQTRPIELNVNVEEKQIEIKFEEKKENVNIKFTDYDDKEIKEELKTLSNDKADKKDIPTKVSQLQNDKGYLSEIPNEYKTKSENDQLYQSKGDYALKSEIPDVSGFITKTVDDLVNYYKKNETYTKQEVNSLIGQISTISILVVDQLPITGESNVIYLVPSENPKVKNEKDEFIWTNNKWEQIGSTAIDLSNYYTKAEVNQLLANIDLSDYYTKSQIDSLLRNLNIPTKLSELEEDTTHRVVTDTEKETWNNKSNFSGAYNDTTGKPAITHTVATIENRVVTLSEVTTTVENTQALLNYGAFNFIPLDMSSYTAGNSQRALLPETHLPYGVYIVTEPGWMRLGNETKNLEIGTLIYWYDSGELDIIGYNACEYWGYDSQNDEWSGGYFTTIDDVEYIVAEKIGWAISNSTLVAGTASMTDGRWSRRTRATGINSLTITFPSELPDYNYKSKLTCKTSSTFTTFKITDRDYDIYFYGDDCVDGVLTGLTDKYYEMEARRDGFDGIIVEVYSHALPTT